jgi:hypothetical protein
MSAQRSLREKLAEYSIWFFAFGYFACYVPYSFTTKVLTKGLLPSLAEDGPLVGFSILPVSVGAAAVGMFVFLTAMRWWKYAHHTRVLGIDLPHPTRWTFLSGLCTALIIGTTTLAYTFEGVSIVFAMLLMRGGVLIIAPIVDAVTGRHVRWFSWAGLVCAMGALLVSLTDSSGFAIPTLCAIDIGIYLASYFIRLRFMSRLAKSDVADANRRYFVEEQITAAPALFLMLCIAALIGTGEVLGTIRSGFTMYWDEPYLLEIILVGFLSQGTGIFGSLIFLDRRENTFCVPVNRSSSIMAGVIASYLLLIFPGTEPPKTTRLIGAGFIIVAILFLTIPPMLAKRKARAAKAAG